MHILLIRPLGLHRSLALPLCLALAASSAGCRGAESRTRPGEYGGTMVISTGADANTLIPPLAVSPTSAQLTDAMFDRLAEPNDRLNTLGDAGYTGRLARSWTWAPDSLSIAFSIDPRARWHDGRSVTARDVRFTFALYSDSLVGSPFRTLVAAIDSVSVRDSMTAVFWFRKRSLEQFFDAAYQMHILPEHALAGVPRRALQTSEFAQHPIGSGPFRLARWVRGASIAVVADTGYYRGRPHLDRVIWSIAPDFAATVVRLFSGDADFLEFMRPENMQELRNHPQIKAVRYQSMQPMFLQFNLRDPKRQDRANPIFADRGVRRALSMAVDRRGIVRNVLDTLGVPAIGPEPRALLTADTTIDMIAYDPPGARAALDRLGWRDTDGDGIRDKSGRPLRFSIAVPSSSSTRVRMAVLLQEMFRQVGAQVDLESMDFGAWAARLQARAFETTINGWSADPSPSTIVQTWGSAAAKKGGQNFGAYRSPAFDAFVDSAVSQLDPARAKAYYRRAYATIIDDAPAVWLYEPVNYAGMSRRIHPTGMRADAWWANLPDWSIPAGERTRRDALPLALRTP